MMVDKTASYHLGNRLKNAIAAEIDLNFGLIQGLWCYIQGSFESRHKATM
jgi:hypothetical protein